MPERNVIIVGAGGHSKTIIDYFMNEDHLILGLADDNATEDVMGYPILGNIGNLKKLTSNGIDDVFVAIGNSLIRQKVVVKIIDMIPDIHFLSAIHPSAIIGKDVSLGEGIFIGANTSIKPSTSIGNFASVNSNVSIGHDCNIGQFTTINPGVMVGGNVFLDSYSTIGMGATILQGLTVGNESTIGAQSLLTKDCLNYEIRYDVPAKLIRPA